MSSLISVAMPTYNGEKYIEEQLLSIINQTVKPDEIIVSDDGSKDKTLEIVEKVRPLAEENGIEIVVLTDNPEHGWIKNYEWASRHAKGDYIFNCDQDDVWMPEKVEKVVNVFKEYPDTLYVAHNISLIDGNGNYAGESDFLNRLVNYDENDKTVQLTKGQHLVPSFASSFFHAMSTCISKKLLEYALPFPKYFAVDQWEPFNALCYGKAYFLYAVLAKHRIHAGNVTQSDKNISVYLKFKRRLKRIKQSTFSINPYYGGKAMIETLEKCGLTETPAYIEAMQVFEVGKKKKEISESGRIIGAVKLIKLFKTNLRYRKSDPKGFIYELCAVLCGRIDT